MPNRLCQKIRKLLGAIQHNGRFKQGTEVRLVAQGAEEPPTQNARSPACMVCSRMSMNASQLDRGAA
ncbi:hypothetical protein ASD03_36635 [Ensifer sp. Root127]|nr:hypothetical protein ASD03_36635 [Ensifer sp. Root127]